jgi:hypothetical protein
MTEQTGAAKLWTECQCKGCHMVDYIPVVSTIAAPFKIVGGLGWGAVWGTVAGVNRTGASILRVAGYDDAADRWQATAGRACEESTKGFMKVGRATIAAVPVVGNGILLGIDAGTGTGWFASSAPPEPPGQDRSWSPPDTQRPPASHPDSPADSDVESGISAEGRRAKPSSTGARSSTSTESLSGSSHGIGSATSSRVSGRWQDDGESTMRETTCDTNQSGDEITDTHQSGFPKRPESNVPVAKSSFKESVPDEGTSNSGRSLGVAISNLNAAGETWKREVADFLKTASLNNSPVDMMQRARSLLQDFEESGLNQADSRAIARYNKLLSYLVGGQSPTRLELLCDAVKRKTQVRLTIDELKQTKYLFDRANATGSPVARQIAVLLENSDPKSRRTSGFLSQPCATLPVEEKKCAPSPLLTRSDQESGAISDVSQEKETLNDLVKAWNESVTAFFKELSVSSPRPDVMNRATSLRSEFQQKRLTRSADQLARRYNKLLNYLLGGGTLNRLEALCNEFVVDPTVASSWTPALTTDEFLYIERLLQKVRATSFPITEEVHVLHEFAKRRLDPRRSDQVTLAPIVSAVRANCRSPEAHYFSETTLDLVPEEKAKQCQHCNTDLRESNPYMPDMEVRELEQAYARLRAKQM